MGRHTFLDTILNRPSQNYAPPAVDGTSGRASKYAGPTDLPNAPGSAPQGSMLSNSFFKRKSRTGSIIGGSSSVAGSDVGGGRAASTSTFGRSRFRRKQRESVSSISQHYPPQLRPGYDGPDMPLPPAASIAPSIADSSASKSKKRWWGSLGGRRSRAPSVAGESIFSEPELPAPAQTPWNPQGRLQGMDSRSPRRSTQSEIGSPSRPRHRSGSAAIPPVPQVPSQHLRQGSYSSIGKPGAPAGRLQSNIAPLGQSTLNPSLTTGKSPKGRSASEASPVARKTALQIQTAPSNNGSVRAMSPPPLPPPSPALSQASTSYYSYTQGRTPHSRPTSPAMRYPSPPPSESGMSRARSATGLRAQAQSGTSSDWKNFVQSFSGTNISKVWEGGRVGSPDLKSAVRARTLSGDAVSQKNDRRWLQVARLQKELEEEAQFEQIQRDPGIVHQDLLARAASVVVGQAPIDNGIRPGSIVPGTATTTGPSSVVRPVATRPSGRQGQQQPTYDPNGSNSRRTSAEMSRSTDYAQYNGYAAPEQSHEYVQEEEESEETTSEDDSEELTSPHRRQTMLEAVREEDEESSITGRSSKRNSRAFSDVDVPSRLATPHKHTTVDPARPTEVPQVVPSPPKAKALPEEDNVSTPMAGNTPTAANVQLPKMANGAQSTSTSAPLQPSALATSATSADDVSSASDASSTEKHQGVAAEEESSSSSEDEDEEEAAPKRSKYALATAQYPPSLYSRVSNSESEMATADEGSEGHNRKAKATLPTEATSSSLASAVTSNSTSTGTTESREEADGDGAATNETQAVKPVVKFDDAETGAEQQKPEVPAKPASQPLSRSVSLNSSMRPAYVRKISDVSLGTSFGLSNMLRPGSRSSSRRPKSIGGSDGGSNAADSDDDADEELKARIKAESDRLRSMKVGEDFFGGSISTILDKFDKMDWSAAGPSQTVGALGLEVGTSSGAKSPEDILALNAQERMNEVRRVRAEDAASTRHGRDNSDSKTIDSLATPSLAALWLLNQANAASQSSDAHAETSSQGTLTQSPSRHASAGLPATASMATMSSVSNYSDGLPRTHSLWSVPDRRASLMQPQAEPAEPSSVLNRPRPRKPKPAQMGGVNIAQGHLDPQAKPAQPETVQEPVEKNRSTLDDIWRGPEESSSRQQLATLMQSKDKPAPAKSAIKKANTPKSLADTLFNISPFSSSDKKGKKSKKDRKSTKVDKAEAEKETEPSKSKEPATEAIATTEPAAALPDSEEPAATNAEEPGSTSREYEQSMASSATRSTLADDMTDDDVPSQVMTPAPALQAKSEAQKRDAATQVKKSSSEASDSNDTPQTVSAMSRDDDNLVSPPPASEAWSAGSTMSTGGPATPSPSDLLGQQNPMAGLQQGKVLPLPPNDLDAQKALESESDLLTPSAIDHDKTPMMERQEPQFGVNLIPPTPPATTDSQPMQFPSGKPALHRSSSSRSRNTLKNEDGLVTRSASSKAKDLLQYPEYTGRGLSLPPGLVAMTVASSASRRRAPETVPEEEPTFAEISNSQKVERKKSKSKKGKKVQREPVPDLPEARALSPAPSTSASQQGEVPMQRTMSEKLAMLAPPSAGTASETSSLSFGSAESNNNSRSPSPGPTPSATVSGRSSSAVSSSAQSDTSSRGRGPISSMVVPPPIPRKVRTVTAGANGHARTSLMSAISEWESSPIDRDPSRSQSPLPSRAVSPRAPSATLPSMHENVPESSIARSDTSVMSGVSPSIVRSAPMGAPTAAILGQTAQTAVAPSNASSYAASAYGRESPAPWRDSYAPGSVMSHGGMSDYSVTSLPAVPQSSSSYKPKDPVKASNAIDDRLYAKTTMLTIAVTSGAFRSKSLRQRRSSSTMAEDARSRAKDDITDGALLEELSKTVISVTSHTPPPRKMGSTQVLVQVIACALDEMDRLILRDRVRGEHAYGFVPGRSFCGRVMETGWEVKRLRKGDVIFGLQTAKKCGALAEFLTIEQELVAKAPEDCLTTEQIAALPSVGILSHQLMVNHCSQLPRGSRILILNAHDGVGLLTMQNCASLGLIIVAHCPQHIADGVAICEANGAHEVIVGEPLWALNTLHESSLDLVVDTVGGRRIYDASRRILAYEGQFCTCFGDLHSANANPNLRSHLRSLRRSFFKKDTKRIGYEWVGADTAEDNREALEAVRQAAEDGSICPRLKSVLAFADAPRAFETTLRGTSVEGDEPGAIVVRVG